MRVRRLDFQVLPDGHLSFSSLAHDRCMLDVVPGKIGQGPQPGRAAAQSTMALQMLAIFAALVCAVAGQDVAAGDTGNTCVLNPSSTVADWRGLISSLKSSAAGSFKPEENGLQQVQASGTAALLVDGSHVKGFNDVRNQLGGVFTQPSVAASLADGPITAALDLCCDQSSDSNTCAAAIDAVVPIARGDRSTALIDFSLQINHPIA